MRSARPLALGAAATAVAVAVTPAAALAATTTKPTGLILKAGHTSVAPKHHDTMTATLKYGRRPLVGRTIDLYEKKPGAKSWGSPIAHHVTDSKGQYTFTVTITGRKGQKNEFEVKFAGGGGYGASHSRVITVTVS